MLPVVQRLRRLLHNKGKLLAMKREKILGSIPSRPIKMAKRKKGKAKLPKIPREEVKTAKTKYEEEPEVLAKPSYEAE